ncbi:MAG: TraR/DksA C4-type zinc finger protein [Propionibacteriaceae bacterium]|jgi:DnaK suppressor protein|nr:TraR/DksA C4-type zinc finger protein [Propionibacteriaceae bacterium]
MAGSQRTADSAADSPDEVSAIIPVGPGEEPWTADELAEVRAELQGEVARMERKLVVAEANLHALLAEGADGAGRDPADVGSSNFERDQGMSLAANAREMLEQGQLALRLFDDGNYGVCEVCGQPIGKARLQAFPRATMCVVCKQRSERR